jgi:anoctamin-10
MAMVNNYVELRSDAFKISKHVRRPIPVRTDSIGPWLECLKNLTWIAALMNPALVYMFNPRYSGKIPDTQLILEWTALIALLASHEFLFTRSVVRFVIERVFWRGSEEQLESEKIEQQAKDICLKSLKGDQVRPFDYAKNEDTLDDFWKQDEGLNEIQKVLKDA